MEKRGKEDARNVLVLTEEGEMEQDLNRLSVGGHDNELADT